MGGENSRTVIAGSILLTLVGVALRLGVFDHAPVAPQVAPVAPLPPIVINIKKPAEGQTDALPPMGYKPDADGTKRFLNTLEKPFIRDAGPELFEGRDIKDGKGVYLYRSLYREYAKKYGKPFVVGSQAIGDCVSWGWMHGIAIQSAILCELGQSSEFDMPATESLYGGGRVEGAGKPGDGRAAYGGWGDGSYGGQQARFVKNWGVLWRREYPFADLRNYSGSKAKEWGAYGNGGKDDGGKADTVAKEFPVASVALVRTFDEAAAAIASGYPVPVCSMQGFASQRDADGFSRASGSWAHCMCFIGVRYAPRPGLLCLNSWGPNWVGGPKFPSDMPEGSFWVEKNVCDRMLGGDDSFAVSGLRGFPYQDLSNGDWVRAEPARRILPSSESHYVLSP